MEKALKRVLCRFYFFKRMFLKSIIFILPSIIVLIRSKSSQFSKNELFSWVWRNYWGIMQGILFFLYQTSQYTKNYLKAKIHSWKKESSIKFLWEAIRQLYEKKDQGSTGIKWCPSILQLHLSINVDCRWRCNIMLGSLDYDKKNVIF